MLGLVVTTIPNIFIKTNDSWFDYIGNKRGVENDVIEVGNIDVKRDFLYIDDLIRAYELILEKDLGGFDVFNTGGGRSCSVKEIVEKVSLEENLDAYSDMSKIKGLGREPTINLKNGLERMPHAYAILRF